MKLSRPWLVVLLSGVCSGLSWAHHATSALSPDATLTTLFLSYGALLPPFDPARIEVEGTVPNTIESVQIYASASEPSATITVGGQRSQSGEWSRGQPLAVGRNTINVDVTSDDGTTKLRYAVKVLRESPTVDWHQVATTNPWAPRDSAGELVFNDRMWLLGGYEPAVRGDVWSTSDGVSWESSADIPAARGVDIPVNFVHRDMMWVTGSLGELFSSKDGAAWTLVNGASPASGRYAVGGTTFKDRMWMLGGLSWASPTLYNDVWSSKDGVDWTRQVERAPWAPRQLFGHVVAHDDRLWVVGGGITRYEPFRGYRDVWSSANGKDWNCVTDEAPWPARIWSTSVVYRNRIFVIGGFRGQPEWENLNDVWYSSDGKDWKRLVTNTIWPARHELSAYVFKDKLWVVGGNEWPLTNDVWTLDIPGLVFLSQPVLEGYVGAGYSYHAEADFNRSAKRLRYTLTAGPDWLTVDEHSGFVHGVSPEPGDYAVTVQAGDEHGETAQQGFSIHIQPL